MNILPNRNKQKHSSRSRIPKTYTAGLLQAGAYRALSSFMTHTLEQYQLSMLEWAIIGAVYDAVKIRPGDLAAILAVKGPVITKYVKDLIRKGWLTSNSDSADSRARIVALAEGGAARVDQVEHTLRRAFRHFMADFSLIEVRRYIKMLEKLAAKNDYVSDLD